VFVYNDDFVPTACIFFFGNEDDHLSYTTYAYRIFKHIVVIMLCRPMQHMKGIALMRRILTTRDP